MHCALIVVWVELWFLRIEVLFRDLVEVQTVGMEAMPFKLNKLQELPL